MLNELLLKMSAITFDQWLMFFAIISGPIIGVQVQKRIEALKEKKSRQLYIFRVLMATRATPLNPEHVNALNLIDIDFSEKKKKEKPVVRAWRVLLDQYGKYPQQLNFNDNNEYLIALNAANQKVQDYLVDLLLSMSECLGYDFETIHIRNGCYAPTGHAEVENDNRLMRKGVIGLLSGQIPLNMNVQSMPEQAPHDAVSEFLQENSDRQQKMLDLLSEIADGTKNLSVKVFEENPHNDNNIKTANNGSSKS